MPTPPVTLSAPVTRPAARAVPVSPLTPAALALSVAWWDATCRTCHTNCVPRCQGACVCACGARRLLATAKAAMACPNNLRPGSDLASLFHRAPSKLAPKCCSQTLRGEQRISIQLILRLPGSPIEDTKAILRLLRSLVELQTLLANTSDCSPLSPTQQTSQTSQGNRSAFKIWQRRLRL